MCPQAIRSLLRFIYTSQLKSDAVKYVEDALNLFRVAVYFDSPRLQELLLADHVIPNMTSATAVRFLYEVHQYDYDE